MDETETSDAAVNYGGTVGDAAGRAGSGQKGGPAEDSHAEDGPATTDEQLDRILPRKGNVPGNGSGAG